MQRNLKVILIAVARGAFTLLAALWIFLEEWVWDAMQACMAWIGKLPGVRWCEARIAGLPPYAAMVAFLIPGARERARLVPVALRKLSEADSRSAEFSTRAATRSLTPFRRCQR